MKRYALPMFCGISLIFYFLMNNNILQWNCRSLKANIEELNILVDKEKPVAICLQETF